MIDSIEIHTRPSGAYLTVSWSEPDDSRHEVCLELSPQFLPYVANQAGEAHLIYHGLERLRVAVRDLEDGDIIPSIGNTVRGNPRFTDTYKSFTHVKFRTTGGLTLPSGLIIEIHRRIR